MVSRKICVFFFALLPKKCTNDVATGTNVTSAAAVIHSYKGCTKIRDWFTKSIWFVHIPAIPGSFVLCVSKNTKNSDKKKRYSWLQEHMTLYFIVYISDI